MAVDLIDFLKQKKVVSLIVETNSAKNSIAWHDKKDVLVVGIKSKPENNKANDEVERYLSRLTGCSVKIIKGKTSKKKTIKLS